MSQRDVNQTAASSKNDGNVRIGDMNCPIPGLGTIISPTISTPAIHIDIGSAEMACARQYKGYQITVSATLVHLLSQEELDAVVAHEVAHLELHHGLIVIPTTDMLPPGLLQKFGALLLVGTAGMSRAMEIAADIRAAHLCGSPQPLMSALRKVCRDELTGNVFELIGRTHPALRTRLAFLSNCPEKSIATPYIGLQ